MIYIKNTYCDKNNLLLFASSPTLCHSIIRTWHLQSRMCCTKTVFRKKIYFFNREKFIPLTATCISGSRLLPMFRLHGIDRWNRRRRMRRSRNRKRFETGARRQIKILFEFDGNARWCSTQNKRWTWSHSELLQNLQHLFQFLLSFSLRMDYR